MLPPTLQANSEMRRPCEHDAVRSGAERPVLNWAPNIWMGVSVEDQKRARRAIDLSHVPAHIRFLSVVPLLGPIKQLPLHGTHWVIVGGESGPGARPIEPRWVDDLLDQCRANAVPFFFKQWGGVQRHRSGRTLWRRTYDEMPATQF